MGYEPRDLATLPEVDAPAPLGIPGWVWIVLLLALLWYALTQGDR